MRVYLVRHGEAKPKEVDPERGLTAAGRREVEAVARSVAGAAAGVPRIWHSGKRRAAETAEILAQFLSTPHEAAPESRARQGLDPDDPVAPVAEELSGSETDVALVGHLPFLARLAAQLLGLDAARAGLLGFQPASVLCLERAEVGELWTIRWFLGPDICTLPAGKDRR
jgi:phosphohistidine phosphatase